MVFNLKFIAIAALASYLAGSFSGLWIAHKWHNYSTMRAAITSLKEANKRYRDAVGVSKDIDEKTSSLELDNETILSAINAKIEAEALRRQKELTNDCKPNEPPVAKPIQSVPNSDECISVDLLRSIGGLK